MEEINNEVPFNFDLERMKKAVESPVVMIPKGLTSEELLDWLCSITVEDKQNVST